MKIVRLLLGSIILFLNFIFTPKSITRTKDAQALIDIETKKLSLYQFNSCPFCVKVRRSIKRLNLSITLRDAKNNAVIAHDLEREGGKRKVPCLRIEKEGQVEWLYESSEIITYLEQRFS